MKRNRPCATERVAQNDRSLRSRLGKRFISTNVDSEARPQEAICTSFLQPRQPGGSEGMSFVFIRVHRRSSAANFLLQSSKYLNAFADGGGLTAPEVCKKMYWPPMNADERRSKL
jgi:hypothetical protein